MRRKYHPTLILVLIFSGIIFDSPSNSLIGGAELKDNTGSSGSVTAEVLSDSIVFPGVSWEIKTPAEVELSESYLDSFVTALDTGENFGGVIIRDGYLVKSWGNQTSKRGWASCKKPVFSTLLFFAIYEEILNSPDDLVRPFVQNVFSGEDLIPADYGMTFRHLAAMTSGYATSSAPGDSFQYNDMAINLYSTLLFHGNGVFGDLSSNVLNEKLGALQFEDGDVFDGGHRLKTTPRDMARIGWFWLNKFRWGDVQLLPESYFTDYVKSQVPENVLSSNDSTAEDYLNIGEGKIYIPELNFGQGIYGFNWWFNNIVPGTSSRAWPALPEDAFLAFGREGNDKACVLMIPSLNMVVAAYGNWGDMDPGNGSSILNQNMQFLNQAVLPVELTNFTATLRDNSIILNWSTKTEINNYGFSIEKRLQENWETIGFVNGNGNSNSPKEYFFTDKKIKFGMHSYRLKQIDTDGKFEYSDIVRVDLGLPKEITLYPNYPNPFNPSTTISFTLPKDANVTLKVFNLLGQEVKTLIDGRKEAGIHSVEFDASGLTSGFYIYRIKVVSIGRQAGEFVQVKKMLLLK